MFCDDESLWGKMTRIDLTVMRDYAKVTYVVVGLD